MTKRLLAFLLTLVLVLGISVTAYATPGEGGGTPVIPTYLPIECPPPQSPCDQGNQDYCNDNEQ